MSTCRNPRGRENRRERVVDGMLSRQTWTSRGGGGQSSRRPDIDLFLHEAPAVGAGDAEGKKASPERCQSNSNATAIAPAVCIVAAVRGGAAPSILDTAPEFRRETPPSVPSLQLEWKGPDGKHRGPQPGLDLTETRCEAIQELVVSGGVKAKLRRCPQARE